MRVRQGARLLAAWGVLLVSLQLLLWAPVLQAAEADYVCLEVHPPPDYDVTDDDDGGHRPFRPTPAPVMFDKGSPREARGLGGGDGGHDDKWGGGQGGHRLHDDEAFPWARSTVDAWSCQSLQVAKDLRYQWDLDAVEGVPLPIGLQDSDPVIRIRSRVDPSICLAARVAPGQHVARRGNSLTTTPCSPSDPLQLWIYRSSDTYELQAVAADPSGPDLCIGLGDYLPGEADPYKGEGYDILLDPCYTPKSSVPYQKLYWTFHVSMFQADPINKKIFPTPAPTPAPRALRLPPGLVVFLSVLGVLLVILALVRHLTSMWSPSAAS
jgi:hypothetical protein